MSAAMENPRVAHLCATLEWGERESRFLAQWVRRQALGHFLVLAAPPGSELARRACRAGLRVLDLEPVARTWRQLEFDLQEYGLTHLEAHDREALAAGRWLRRRLRIPLVPPAGIRPGWLARWFDAARRREGQAGTAP